jgi:iron complex outermembrane recepter protein
MLRYLVPGLVSSLVVVPAWAESQSDVGDKSSVIEEVVVTLAPGGKSQDELAQSADVLGGDSLQRQRAASLGETLSQQAGIASSGYGAAVARPVIRGMGGSRIAVLQDGMDSADASSISPDHAVAVHLQGASQIEVLRGPATLLYGSGAFGGVVNVVESDETSPLPDGGETELNLQYQTVNAGTSVGVRHENETGPLRWHADFSQNRSGDYRIPSAATDDHDDKLENSDIDLQQELAVGGRYHFDSGSAGVSVGWLKSNFGLPGHEHSDSESADHAHEDDKEEGVPRVALVQRRLQSDLALDNPLEGIDSLKVKLAVTDYQHAEGHEGTDSATASKTLFERDVNAVRVEAALSPMANWE